MKKAFLFSILVVMSQIALAQAKPIFWDLDFGIFRVDIVTDMANNKKMYPDMRWSDSQQLVYSDFEYLGEQAKDVTLSSVDDQPYDALILYKVDTGKENSYELYKRLQSSLIEEYKEPYSYQMEFKYPYLEDDSRLLEAIRNKKVNIGTSWMFPLDEPTVLIIIVVVGLDYVAVSYTDLNLEKKVEQ